MRIVAEFCFSHSAYWLPSRNNTLHGGQSCSWSTEQGNEKKILNLAAHPPRPLLQHAARTEEIK